MKYFYIVALLLTGCSVTHTPRLDPKFNYGQKVIVTSNFYKDLQGTIKSWKYCAYESKDGDLHQGVCYYINHVNGEYIYELENVHEEELIASESK